MLLTFEHYSTISFISPHLYLSHSSSFVVILKIYPIILLKLAFICFASFCCLIFHSFLYSVSNLFCYSCISFCIELSIHTCFTHSFIQYLCFFTFTNFSAYHHKYFTHFFFIVFIHFIIYLFSYINFFTSFSFLVVKYTHSQSFWLIYSY